MICGHGAYPRIMTTVGAFFTVTDLFGEDSQAVLTPAPSTCGLNPSCMIHPIHPSIHPSIQNSGHSGHSQPEDPDVRSVVSCSTKSMRPIRHFVPYSRYDVRRPGAHPADNSKHPDIDCRHARRHHDRSRETATVTLGVSSIECGAGSAVSYQEERSRPRRQSKTCKKKRRKAKVHSNANTIGGRQRKKGTEVTIEQKARRVSLCTHS